jgi:hypothetical protein
MKVCSIGFYREDGDFAILATLNNNDELIDGGTFTYLLDMIHDRLQKALSDEQGEILRIETLERQDAPDYVDVEE